MKNTLMCHVDQEISIKESSYFVPAHPRIEPKSFLQQDVVDAYKHDYLFIACIDFINRVKTGPFPEHSNQLWNVSGVPNWSRVNQGLIKMYKVEVLNKFPVIQHVLFGSLMPFRMVTPNNTVRGTRLSVTPQEPLQQAVNLPGPIADSDAGNQGDEPKN